MITQRRAARARPSPEASQNQQRATWTICASRVTKRLLTTDVKSYLRQAKLTLYSALEGAVYARLEGNNNNEVRLFNGIKPV